MLMNIWFLTTSRYFTWIFHLDITMEFFAVLFLVCAGVCSVDADAECNVTSLKACTGERDLAKFQTPIEEGDISAYKTESILNDTCSHVDAIETCMATNNCEKELDIYRWLGAVKYLCGPGREVYLENVDCYFDAKTRGELTMNCRSHIVDSMTDDEKCKSFKENILCAAGVYTRNCNETATDTIIKAMKLVANPKVPGPEHCILDDKAGDKAGAPGSGYSPALSFSMMLTTLFFYKIFNFNFQDL